MRISKAQVAWGGLMAALQKVIENWNPARFRSELQFRDSLVDHLRRCAPEARVEKEYRDNGTTTDIYFVWEGLLETTRVFIELKRDLHQKAQLDRLVGQIELLEPRQNHVIVVFCGTSDEQLLGRFRYKYRHQLTEQFLLEPQMLMICKETEVREHASSARE